MLTEFDSIWANLRLTFLRIEVLMISWDREEVTGKSGEVWPTLR